MYEKINYTLVGIFVIIFSSLATYFAFWLAKGDISKDNFNIYYTYFSESVDGLNKDSVVKLNGVNVGRLKELSIDKDEPSKVIAKIYIDKNVKVTKDMYAILKSQGLTGLRYINIVGGKAKDTIEPNTTNSIIKSRVSLLSKLSNESPQILTKLSVFSERLNKLLSDKNLENFTKLVENSKDITKKALILEDNINSFLKDFNSTSIYKLTQDFNKTAISTLNEYKKLAINGNKSLSVFNKRLPTLLNSMQTTLYRLSKTTKLIDKSIKRGDYNLNRILTPAVIDLKILAKRYLELGDELNSILKSPTNAIFNGTYIPKGPGE